MKKFLLIVGIILAVLPASSLFAKYEQEQLEMETEIQQKIDGVLSKTLPPDSYLITVKVEMESGNRSASRRTTAHRGGERNFLQNQYVLPGVPQKKEFVPAPETETDTTEEVPASPEALVKRILITILVAPDITADQIRSIRDVLSSTIAFNPLRGDEMDIQNSSLLKPTNSSGSPSPGAPSVALGGESRGNRATGFLGSLSDRANAPMMMFLGAFSMAFILFVAFLFGPVRAFLNRLLAVLPRIGEQAAYTVSNAPAKASTANASVGGAMTYGGNGNGYGPSEEDSTRPFRFIREDQLNKLPILFRSLSPAQCALVLAYLPAEWASKVLGILESGVQTQIMEELSQAREIPPEIVNEVESQIKSKLPYLVGGVDWIQSVYQLTQPSTQKALLGTLNQQSPELAQTLRRKTFFLEDLNVISAGALRVIIQEAGYPVAAQALRDEKPEYRDALLKKLPVAMREILEQELDLSGDDKRSMIEAKVRLLDVGRRLLADGRIALPESQAR
jgi:hypothetical protein